MRKNNFRKNIYIHTLEFAVRIVFAVKYKFVVKNRLSKDAKSVVLIGNHVSFIDWAFLQMGTSQKIHFFIEKEIYEKPMLRSFLAFFGALPIDAKNAKESLQKGIEILKNGGIVAIFPEGELSKTGKISKFKKGFEFLAQKSGAEVVPFYIDGLFGSRFSKKPTKSYKRRVVSLTFGKKLEKIEATVAEESVTTLRHKS